MISGGSRASRARQSGGKRAALSTRCARFAAHGLRASVLDCGGPPPLWNSAPPVNQTNEESQRSTACEIRDEHDGWQDEACATAPEVWRTTGRCARFAGLTPTRQRLDCGGFSTAFGRAMMFNGPLTSRA